MRAKSKRKEAVGSEQILSVSDPTTADVKKSFGVKNGFIAYILTLLIPIARSYLARNLVKMVAYASPVLTAILAKGGFHDQVAYILGTDNNNVAVLISASFNGLIFVMDAFLGYLTFHSSPPKK